MASEAHRGSFHRRSRRVRVLAYANPWTRCWRCGLTLAEEQARCPDRRVSWDAGHVVPGDPWSLLAAEHSTCNRSEGGRRGGSAAGRGRGRSELNPSRKWY